MADRTSTVLVARAPGVARVTLNRPDIRNAFNDVMIRELAAVFAALKDDPELRVVVLTGAGSAFCAGADLQWMGEVLSYTKEQNLRDSTALATLLREIYDFPRPVIGRINGPAIGGGTGVTAVTDIAIASDDAVFSFSEVKLGLVPAVISPYVLKRVGERHAREYFLTGVRLTAADAVHCGLVNRVVPKAELDGAVDEVVKHLLSSGPEAVMTCKRMVRDVAELSLDAAAPYTANIITELRMSAEGQEGMRAFLDKREPAWRSRS
ncbi:MAG: enoyl-CoA hydratase/isomerase family protein [Deltaproteobacteria bacterium]|nr:enoyl-CoA hydratase/isomerase family protein [Deltaproteobacteria bacterium]